MDATDGWRPLRRPRRAEGFGLSEFARLARTHALSVSGDTMVTLALADSVFFGISPSDARPRVLLYLVLTMAPFAVVAPLLGPWIDATRGGRRLMLMVAAGGRAGLCVLLIDDLDSLLLFPEAFLALVLAKSHSVARSALVPVVVRDPSELVEANSKLALVSGLVGFATGLPGLLVLAVGGAEWVLALGAVLFLATAVSASRVAAEPVAATPAGALEREELRGGGVRAAASAMALLRGIVGFLTFFVAFLLRTDDAPAWWFGVVIGLSAAGAMAGAAAAPRLRRSVREEWIVIGGLGLVAVAAVVAATNADRPATAFLSMVVGVAASGAKSAFDAIVQRDAPDANQGRSFAAFETRFQLAWVIAAVPPVIVSIPARVGMLAVAAAAAFAAASYFVGLRAAGRGNPLDPSAGAP